MQSKSMYNPFSTLRYNGFNRYGYGPSTTFYQPHLKQNTYMNQKASNTNFNNNNDIKIYEADYIDIQENNNLNDKTINITPICDNSNSISLFGFSLAIDDLIIIGLAIFLLMEGSCDYIFIIMLGLILFDIKLSSIADLGIVRKLGIFN